MTVYTEAEIQALIAWLELANPQTTPNNNHYTFYPQSLEEAASYFRCYRVAFEAACAPLAARGLMAHGVDGYVLTPAGMAEAQRLRRERPPIWYFYKEFYSAAPHSPTFARFCAQLYGRHLHQNNFSDMAQLATLLEVAQFTPQSRVLDLGCGAGMIAGYIAEATGAQVTGIDYMPEAIAAARLLTARHRDRLHFQVGNLDDLPLTAGPFDAILAVDTLYMPNSLDATLARMRTLLAPGGQMLLFWVELLWDPATSPVVLQAAHTPLGEALQRAGLAFRTWDFSAATYALLQRKRRLADELAADFAAEGNFFLYQDLCTESESNEAPFDPAHATLSRYLYQVRVPIPTVPAAPGQ